MNNATRRRLKRQQRIERSYGGRSPRWTIRTFRRRCNDNGHAVTPELIQNVNGCALRWRMNLLDALERVLYLHHIECVPLAEIFHPGRVSSSATVAAVLPAVSGISIDWHEDDRLPAVSAQDGSQELDSDVGPA